MTSISDSFTDSIFKEINGVVCNIFGKRSVMDEMSITFKAFCPKHKENQAAYCLCGINEEKKLSLEEEVEVKPKLGGQKQIVEGKAEINSVYCNMCCTWYHAECVDYKVPS